MVFVDPALHCGAQLLGIMDDPRMVVNLVLINVRPASFNNF